MASGFSKAGVDSTSARAAPASPAQAKKSKSSPNPKKQAQEPETRRKKNPRINFKGLPSKNIEKKESWKVERNNRTPE
jgi:hypothetical protein